MLLAPLVGLPGVAAAAAEARDAVDGLLRHRALRRRSAEVSAESALRGARASAALDGVDHSLDDVRAGDPDPVVQGALRVGEALGSLADAWRRTPFQALARLHMLAATGLVDDDALGRPVPGQDIAVRLEQLSRIVIEGSGAPAVIEAAVVHGEILALQAFPRAGGVVARAASRLTMLTRGLDPKSLTVPEIGWVEAGPAYGEALAGYAAGGSAGVAGWLRLCCAATVRGAQEGLAMCESLARS